MHLLITRWCEQSLTAYSLMLGMLLVLINAITQKEHMDQFSYINDFLNVEYADLVRHYIAPVNCKIIVEPWRSIVASAGVLIIKDTDAYGAVKSFTYNTRLLSRELLVKGQDYAAIRAPQSLDELIDKDIMPNWHAAQK